MLRIKLKYLNRSSKKDLTFFGDKFFVEKKVAGVGIFSVADHEFALANCEFDVWQRSCFIDNCSLAVRQRNFVLAELIFVIRNRYLALKKEDIAIRKRNFPVTDHNIAIRNIDLAVKKEGYCSP